jgi:hypothetical protein
VKVCRIIFKISKYTYCTLITTYLHKQSLFLYLNKYVHKLQTAVWISRRGGIKSTKKMEFWPLVQFKRFIVSEQSFIVSSTDCTFISKLTFRHVSVLLRGIGTVASSVFQRSDAMQLKAMPCTAAVIHLCHALQQWYTYAMHCSSDTLMPCTAAAIDLCCPLQQWYIHLCHVA